MGTRNLALRISTIRFSEVSNPSLEKILQRWLLEGKVLCHHSHTVMKIPIINRENFHMPTFHFDDSKTAQLTDIRANINIEFGLC